MGPEQRAMHTHNITDLKREHMTSINEDKLHVLLEALIQVARKHDLSDEVDALVLEKLNIEKERVGGNGER